LATDGANLLIGGTKSLRSQPAWRQVYRSLDHGATKEKCKNRNFVKLFPKGIEDFANAFVTLQEKRHSADYDPFFKIAKSDVQADIEIAKSVINDFLKCSTKHRRAFSAYVLLKTRN